MLGFGEVGSVFAEVIRHAGWPGPIVACYVGREPSPQSLRRAHALSVPLISLYETATEADLVISVVTPAAAIHVAQALADRVSRPAHLLNLASIGPESVSEIHGALHGTAIEFVNGAILGPVPLLRDSVPLAVGGSEAAAVAAWLRDNGFKSVTECRDLADPARLKMLWSVVTKGIIPLYAESLIAAYRMDLLGPLQALVSQHFGFFGSREMILRLLHSSIASGSRRIDEMREVCSTLSSAGVPARSSQVAIEWLADLAQLVERANNAPVQAGKLNAVDDLVEWLSTVLSAEDR